MTIFFAVLSICTSVAAQFVLKRGVSSVRTKLGHDEALPAVDFLLRASGDIYVILGLSLYALSAVVWLAVLAQWDVSKAYPLVGLGFILTLITGWALGEAVTAQRVFGVCLIAVGVALVART